MIPKISLTAAFLLMMAPPMACASVRDAAKSAPITCQMHESPRGIVLAQDGQEGQPSMGTTDSDNSSDNDNDSNDNADDNQNGDNGQNGDSAETDQNADQQTIPPTVLGPDNDGEPRPAPLNGYPQPVNPYQ